MPRYSAGGIASAAATATLPSVTLAAASGSGCRLRQLSIFNTTTSAFYATLRRFSTAGTRGSAVNVHGPANSPAAACTVADANTSTAPTLVNGVIEIAAIAASIGSGVIWTFDDTTAELLAGTGNMFGILCPSGTGQVFTYTWHWDE
jgi:hypothetical protein